MLNVASKLDPSSFQVFFLSYELLWIIYGLKFSFFPPLKRVQLNRWVSTNPMPSLRILSLSIPQLAITQNRTLITILYQVRMIYLSLCLAL